MAWTFKFDSTRVSIEDLPIEQFETIAKKHDVSWYELLSTPGAHPTALWEVCCLAADAAGAAHPAKPEKLGDVVKLIGLLELGTDDLPTEWADGNPPEGDPATT